VNISELIEQLEDLRDEHGDDTEVLAAYQENWPLAGVILGAVVVEDGDDEDEDEEPNAAKKSEPQVAWIAIGNHPRHRSPYAPKAAWAEAGR
jgi:hypothetical protein